MVRNPFLSRSWLFSSLGIGAITIVMAFQNCARIDFNDDVVAGDGTQGQLETPLTCATPEGVANVTGSINGPIELEQGQVGTFTLNGMEACESRFSIRWISPDMSSEIGTENPASTGTTFRRGFGLPGLYTISAIVLDNSLDLKELTHQVLVREKCRSGTACNDEARRAAIAGPTVGYVGDLYTFRISTNLNITSLNWIFGSNSNNPGKDGQISLSFRTPGFHEVHAEFKDSSGATHRLTHFIQILERPVVPGEGPCCDNDDPPTDEEICRLDGIQLSGPTVLGVKEAGLYRLSISPCVREILSSVTWTIDSLQDSSGEEERKATFAQPGKYLVKAKLILTNEDGTTTTVTVSRYVTVIDEVCRIEVPNSPVPPVPGNSCSPLKEGQAIDEVLAISIREESCGIDGYKKLKFEKFVSRTCKNGRNQVSTVKERKVSESPCLGQSCQLTNGTKILSGGSLVLYTEAKPLDSCNSHKVLLICTNGVLNRQADGLLPSCRSGCDRIGRDGDTKYISDGTSSTPKQCTFGETGYNEVFKKEKLVRCDNGTSVDTGLTQIGEKVSSDACPTYAWAQTGWTECSAACGGDQSAIYECRSNTGTVLTGANTARCGTMPVQKRICSSNSDDDVSETRLSYLPGTSICPKNEIGSILTEVRTTTSFRCIDHKYQIVSETSSSTTRSYCKPYVVARCSHDSLSPSQALGRYAWMKKCEATVPQFKDFFEKLKGVPQSPDEVYKSTYKVDSAGKVTYGRMTYATFMLPNGQPWSAPAPGSTNYTLREPLPDVSGISCSLPAESSIAAVCLSSCLTPEQSISIEATDVLLGRTSTMLESYQSGRTSIAGVSENSTLEALSYHQTKVDRFVTELVDSEHLVLNIRTAKGREVRLTPNHAVLVSTGEMIEARNIEKGTLLVGKDGAPDAVVQITESTHFGKVYNVFVGSSNPTENLIVAQDLIVGTGFFQNEGADLLNRKLLRQALTKDVLK